MTTETVGEVVMAFRVVAETKAGREGLVCLGETRGQAVGRARLFARHKRLPAKTVWLRLERWDGRRWVVVRTGRKELPDARLTRPRVSGR